MEELLGSTQSVNGALTASQSCKQTLSADVICLEGFVDLLQACVFDRGGCMHPTFPLKVEYHSTPCTYHTQYTMHIR